MDQALRLQAIRALAETQEITEEEAADVLVDVLEALEAEGHEVANRDEVLDAADDDYGSSYDPFPDQLAAEMSYETAIESGDMDQIVEAKIRLEAIGGQLACPNCGSNQLTVGDGQQAQAVNGMQEHTCNACGTTWFQPNEGDAAAGTSPPPLGTQPNQPAQPMGGSSVMPMGTGAAASLRRLGQTPLDSELNTQEPYDTEQLDDPETMTKNAVFEELMTDNEGANVDPQVIQNAVNRAYLLAQDQGFAQDKEKIKAVANFYIGKTDEQTVMGMLRGAKESLRCPACRGKVARRRDNPQVFECPHGHRSLISLKKKSAPVYDLGTQDDSAPDSGTDAMSDGLNTEEEVHEHSPEEGADETGLSQSEKNRLNDALYQTMAEASTPLYLCGVLDGFFGSTQYDGIAQSPEEQSEYGYGHRQGAQARGGDQSNTEIR